LLYSAWPGTTPKTLWTSNGVGMVDVPRKKRPVGRSNRGAWAARSRL